LIKRWAGVGILLVAVLALSAPLLTGQSNVHADSALGPSDNVTGTDNRTVLQKQVSQSNGYNNANDGGVMETTSQYILIDVDCWHSGYCSVCDEFADYKCSTGMFCCLSPCPFADPLPQVQMVTRIEAEVRGVSCFNTLTRIYINDTLIGEGFQSSDNCQCGTCFPLVISSKTYSGLPGYVYGGENRLSLQIEGTSCISDVHLKIYYKKSLITTNPISHGAGGFSFNDIIPSQPINPPNIIVQNASVSQTTVSPGEKVDVMATVINKGGSNGAAKITMYINGQEELSQGVTVNSGSVKPVTFTVSRNEPGTYNVYVNSVPGGSFVVDSHANLDILIYAIMALLAIGIVGTIYLLVKRRTA